MRVRVRVAVVATLVLAVGVAAMLTAWRPDERSMSEPGVSITAVLGGVPDDGFARALVPRALDFPRDHGPHPDYRNEWWYWTGNVATAGGRRFGFQLTFFRIALAPRVAVRASAWGTRDVWMAHLAITDVVGGRFRWKSRLSRDGLGLAGAASSRESMKVWLEDWSARAVDTRPVPRMRLVAQDADIGLDLTLEARKPVVLHGDRGLSRKSAEPGGASHYYSLTRLDAAGEVAVGGERFPVRGLAWMDREWSTSALAPDQAGWDWFALHLGDGRDVMLYRLRRADGSLDPHSGGTIVARDGASRSLAPGEVDVETVSWWSSPDGGTRYPARWRIAIPGEGLALEVEPHLADQELREPVRYWEGAVSVRGRAGAAAVRGAGYVELVGYAGRDARGRR